MLGTPICFLICIYSAFLYGECDRHVVSLCPSSHPHSFFPGIFYGNLEGFAIEFEEIRGWGPIVSKLPFLAMLVGICFAAAVNVWNNGYYMKTFKANGNKGVPEARLPPMMMGSVAFAGGLFVFACESQSQTVL